MGVYIQTGASTYVALTGTKGIFVKNVLGSYNRVQQGYVKNLFGNYQQFYQFDVTGPVVPAPTFTTRSATSETISYGAITDASSSVASATIYQVFYGSSSFYTAGDSYSITTFGGGSQAFSIPTGRRNTPSGETWTVWYYIIATDSAGNSTTGAISSQEYTSPYGVYSFAPTGADARNIGDTAWLSQTTSDEGMVGVSTTKAYGAWFYGSTAFSDKTRGWKPDSGTISLQRAGAAQTNKGNTGTFSIQAHTSPTKSGLLSYVGSAITQYLSGNDAFDSPSLNNAQLNGLRDSTIYGFALTAHSASPGFLRGLTVSSNNNPFGVYSGTVVLTYN